MKHENKIKRIVTLVALLIFSSLRCSPAKGTMASSSNYSSGQTSDPQDQNQNRGDKSKICIKNSALENCFGVLERGALFDQKRLYNYPNPKTDRSFPKKFDERYYHPPHRLIDIRDVSPQTLLSPRFTRENFMQENSKRGHFGLFSPFVIQQIEIMQDLLKIPLIITGGYRSPGHNATIPGAAKWSRHIYGDALDLKVPGMKHRDVAKYCLQAGASFYQLYSDHIHCDWRKSPLPIEFYGNKSIENPAPLHSHEQLSIYQEISEASEIVELTSLNLAQTQSLRLGTKTIQEDAGELLHLWLVQFEDGSNLESEEPEITIPIKPGKISVEVQIGGSIHLTKTFNF